MNASEALGRLKRLRVPAATTADAAAVLGVSGEAASHMLRRLARSGLVTPLRKGVWALADRPDPLALAEYVTTPYPSYLSLQTALYRHGMIEQIPSMIFLVSLARSGRVETGLGTYSVHHVQPAFFDGFESLPDSGSERHLRCAQLALLRTISGLVKDDGVVVIGMDREHRLMLFHQLRQPPMIEIAKSLGART